MINFKNAYFVWHCGTGGQIQCRPTCSLIQNVHVSVIWLCLCLLDHCYHIDFQLTACTSTCTQFFDATLYLYFSQFSEKYINKLG